jgi:hypothetical protein
MLEYSNLWPTSRAATLLWYCRSAATSYSKASYTAGRLPYSTDGRRREENRLAWCDYFKLRAGGVGSCVLRFFGFPDFVTGLYRDT